MLNYAAGNPVTGYNLTRSLRTRASASAYLSKAQIATGNGHKFTLSTWMKRGQLGAGPTFFCTSAGVGNNNALGQIYFTGADKLGFFQYSGGTIYTDIVTTQVFRDPSAWYHIVIAYDDTQATASNRVLIYVNGTQVTSFSSASYPSQNFNSMFNTSTNPIWIGNYLGNTSYFDGYLAEVNFIDGQALTPSSFGSTNSTTGVWQPAKYTGTYGTNGFYLPFTDNSALTTSSNVGLGKDFSGNGNYWTTNNISITAGTTYDSMTDVPTLTSATAANFAVLNPLDSGGVTLSNGNLTYTGSASDVMVRSSIFPPSGKWYWEIQANASSLVGTATTSQSNTSYPGGVTGSFGYYGTSGQIFVNTLPITTVATYTTIDVIGLALNTAANTCAIYKNNVLQTTVTSLINPVPAVGRNGSAGSINFGQRPFTYTPPSGFVALNTYNLPDSTIKQGSTAMNIALNTGANIKTSTEALFTGQFAEWIKDLANTNNHQLLNSVRGLSAVTQSNTQSAETTYTAPSGNSVGYAWKAGASSSSNTNGTITTTVSANPNAGFSYVTYVGNTVPGATIGHGLGVAPSFGIFKNLSAATDWQVYHSALGGNAASFLNTTGAANTSSLWWNNTAPTSSVMSLGSISYVNGLTQSIGSLLWSEIPGYSKFGSYAGNGSVDGPMIYTGMRGRWLLIKAITSVSGGNWVLIDTANNTYNVCNNWLFPDSTTAISSYINVLDINSNGFKIRSTWDSVNNPSATYMYAMFAENPLKYALAR